MKIEVRWVDKKQFKGVNAKGLFISMDASPDHGGEGKGPSPMEVLAMGVGGCTAMDVIELLKKMRQDVTDFEIAIDIERAADHPKVFTKMILDYKIFGRNIDEKTVQRAVELSRDKYCSGIAMISKSAAIETRWSIHPPKSEITT